MPLEDKIQNEGVSRTMLTLGKHKAEFLPLLVADALQIILNDPDLQTPESNVCLCLYKPAYLCFASTYILDSKGPHLNLIATSTIFSNNIIFTGVMLRNILGEGVQLNQCMYRALS